MTEFLPAVMYPLKIRFRCHLILNKIGIYFQILITINIIISTSKLTNRLITVVSLFLTSNLQFKIYVFYGNFFINYFLSE